jgi:hypothetical protein
MDGRCDYVQLFIRVSAQYGKAPQVPWIVASVPVSAKRGGEPTTPRRHWFSGEACVFPQRRNASMMSATLAVTVGAWGRTASSSIGVALKAHWLCTGNVVSRTRCLSVVAHDLIIKRACWL